MPAELDRKGIQVKLVTYERLSARFSRKGQTFDDIITDLLDAVNGAGKAPKPAPAPGHPPRQ